MKNILLVVLTLSYQVLTLAQTVSLGLGFEINQTRFRQEAPTVKVEFSNPHQAAIGISANSSVGLLISNKYDFTVKPGLSILRTKSQVTTSNEISFLDFSFEFGYYVTKSLQIKSGVDFKYLISLIKKLDGQSADFTFFSNHRTFINPTVSIAYGVHKNWSLHFRFVYFLRDLFNSGALDINGNIVGPIMVYPYTIGLGVNCNFEINQPEVDCIK